MVGPPKVVVLTRFAVPHRSPTDATSTTDETFLDQNWLGRRLELLNEFCAPSVAQQSLSDHLWLLLVDHRISATVVQDIIEIAGERSQVVSVSPHESIASAVSRTLIWLRYAGPSIRLDSDDVIEHSLLERVVRHSKANVCINFPNIALYDTRDQRVYSRFPYWSNPFISYTSNTIGQNVFSLGSHDEVAAGIKNVWTRLPVAIQIVHGGNLLNQANARQLASRRVVQHVNDILASIASN